MRLVSSSLKPADFAAAGLIPGSFIARMHLVTLRNEALFHGCGLLQKEELLTPGGHMLAGRNKANTGPDGWTVVLPGAVKADKVSISSRFEVSSSADS